VFENKTSTLLDIFGMGSIFYTILTGRWPYKTTPGRFAKVDDRLDWEERIVYPNFKAGKFPDVEQLPGGNIILKCWMRQYATAREALSVLEEALPGHSRHGGLKPATLMAGSKLPRGRAAKWRQGKLNRPSPQVKSNKGEKFEFGMHMSVARELGGALAVDPEPFAHHLIPLTSMSW
jgi:hypothetical protein